MKSAKTMKIAAVAIAIALFAAQPASAGVSLTGAGATFPIPLLDACKAGYSADSGNSYTYSGGGSGAGRTASDKGIGDFNFTDVPHTAATRLSSVIHIPVVAAPIAIMYNIGRQKNLYLSPSTISGIFSGNIKMWNDPAIVADTNRTVKTVTFVKDAKGNVKKSKKGKPIVKDTLTQKIIFSLPAQKITVVYRSDSSGTSQNFTNWLVGTDAKTWTKPSSGVFANAFPGDINAIDNLGRLVSASGSSAVAALAAKTPFSITYAEKSYAKANRLSIASVKNPAGDYQAPDAGGTSVFIGEGTQDAAGFLKFDYTTKAPGAYTLGVVSYVLVDTKISSDKAPAVKAFLNYLLSTPCTSKDPSLEYTTITGKLLAFNQKQIAKIGA